MCGNAEGGENQKTESEIFLHIKFRCRRLKVEITGEGRKRKTEMSEAEWRKRENGEPKKALF